MKKSTQKQNAKKPHHCPVCHSKMAYDPDNNLWCEQCNHTENA